MRNHRSISSIRGQPTSTRRKIRWSPYLVMLLVAALVLSACAPMVTPVAESQAPEAGMAITPEAVEETLPVLPNTRLMNTLGFTALDSRGETVATIEDYMIDIAAGQVLYAVLAFHESFTETAGNLYPVPMDFVRLDREDATLLVNVNQETLANAPRLDSEIITDAAGLPAWDSTVRTYWQNAGMVEPGVLNTLPPQPDVLPYYRYGVGIRMLPGTLTQFTNFLARQIDNPAGENLGTIRDLIVDRTTGRIPYVVIFWEANAMDAEAYLEGNLSIQPLGTLTWNIQDSSLLFNLGRATIVNAPRFAPDAWPDLAAVDWNTELQQYWNDVNTAVALRAGIRVLPEAVMRADEVLNRSVTGFNGESLGTLEDIMVDTNDGSLDFAVLDLSGVFNLGGDYHVVPANSLSLDPFSRVAFLGIDRETLTNSPTLAPEQLGEVADPTWDDPFANYWRAWMMPTVDVQAEQVQEAQIEVAPTYAPVSRLIGYAVQNQNGDALGNVEEMVFNLTQGNVAYAVLSFGGFLDMGDKLFAVPMSLLTPDLNTDNRTLVFNVEPAQLEEMPGFDQDDWPEVSNPRWREEVRDFWRTYPDNES